MLFTFWEGPMPAYVELCLATWKRPFEVLTYKNLHNYSEIDIKALQKFTLPQIADFVRVHVLRDHGGYWLDADTIMLSNNLPEETMVGDPATRTNSIGLLHAEKGSEMFRAWAAYQDEVVRDADLLNKWDIMGNRFTDPYLIEHPEIEIHPIWKYYPESYMMNYVTRFDN